MVIFKINNNLLIFFLRFFLLFCILKSSASFGSGHLDKFYEYHNKGDFKKAFEEILPIANSGDRLAQSNLGMLYRYGKGTELNLNEAEKWFTLALVQGSHYAQSRLGVMYLSDFLKNESDTRTINILKKKGFKLILLAAEQGDAWGQNFMGQIFRDGRADVIKNNVIALMWLTLSANQGNETAIDIVNTLQNEMSTTDIELAKEAAQRCEKNSFKKCLGYDVLENQKNETDEKNYKKGITAAENNDFKTALKIFEDLANKNHILSQYEMGNFYENGLGVSRDFKKAASWYRKASEQGESTSQLFLGLMYYYGQGVPEDFVSALMWTYVSLTSSSELGDKKEVISFFKEKMTNEEVFEAQEFAALCFKNDYKGCRQIEGEPSICQELFGRSCKQIKQELESNNNPLSFCRDTNLFCSGQRLIEMCGNYTDNTRLFDSCMAGLQNVDEGLKLLGYSSSQILNGYASCECNN